MAYEANQSAYRAAYDCALAELEQVDFEFEQLTERKRLIEGIVRELGKLIGSSNESESAESSQPEEGDSSPSESEWSAKAAIEEWNSSKGSEESALESPEPIELKKPDEPGEPQESGENTLDDNTTTTVKVVDSVPSDFKPPESVWPRAIRRHRA